MIRRKLFFYIVVLKIIFSAIICHLYSFYLAVCAITKSIVNKHLLWANTVMNKSYTIIFIQMVNQENCTQFRTQEFYHTPQKLTTILTILSKNTFAVLFKMFRILKLLYLCSPKLQTRKIEKKINSIRYDYDDQSVQEILRCKTLSFGGILFTFSVSKK